MLEHVCSFSVPGNPLSKERARTVGDSGSKRSYTPERTSNAEEMIQWAFLNFVTGVEPQPTWRYRVMLAFVASDRVHRDVDNMGKLVLDALNGHVWGDDWQVDELSIRRVFVADKKLARTDIEIYKIGELP